MKWLFAMAALGCGVVLTTQVATNKQLGEALHNLYIPAVVNMIVGLLATLAITLIASRQYPTLEMVKDAPWYGWLAGGTLGAIYLTGNILLAPRLGAAALVGLVVTGQITFSVLVDHFGWFGFEQHDANWLRLAGGALLIGGMGLIAKF